MKNKPRPERRQKKPGKAVPEETPPPDASVETPVDLSVSTAPGTSVGRQISELLGTDLKSVPKT
ncbi:MAG: hypothetical protein KKE00_06880 [Proteobacteria bacterium]|nr:hypothetical protein [Pseudomonadota bacterium]MBU1570224.1 hypothetical protein [Pseudomonadota bacterium]